MIGMVVVACFAGTTAPPAVTITSTFARIRLSASAAKRSLCPSAQRYSMLTFRPSTPIGTGLVASLAHPGGNVTGLSVQATELAGKRVELLRELIPNLRRLAIIANPDY